MELATITMERPKARKAFLDYRRAVRARHDDEDAEIMRGYRALSQGHQLLHLSETISAGGFRTMSYVRWGPNDEVVNLLPRLAIVRADARFCLTAGIERDGSVRFQNRLRLSPRNRKDVVDTAPGTFSTERFTDAARFVDEGPPVSASRLGQWDNSAWRAMAPIVPPALRPQHALSGYHVLFEAEWSRHSPPAPVDPALLKHIGGELYAVVCMWELTELERAVLGGRVLA